MSRATPPGGIITPESWPVDLQEDAAYTYAASRAYRDKGTAGDMYVATLTQEAAAHSSAWSRSLLLDPPTPGPGDPRAIACKHGHGFNCRTCYPNT